MYKYAIFTFLLTMMPCISVADSARVQELIALKQSKMETLKKCKGTTKNLKIAGLSTLGVTTVGVGVNIAEAVILKQKREQLAAIKTNNNKSESEQNELLVRVLCKQKGKMHAFYKDKTCYLRATNLNDYDDIKSRYLPNAECITSEHTKTCTSDGIKFVVEDMKTFGSHSKERQNIEKQEFADMCSRFNYIPDNESYYTPSCVVGENTDADQDVIEKELKKAADTLNKYNPAALCGTEVNKVDTDGYAYIECFTIVNKDPTRIVYVYNKESDTAIEQKTEVQPVETSKEPTQPNEPQIDKEKLLQEKCNELTDADYSDKTCTITRQATKEDLNDKGIIVGTGMQNSSADTGFIAFIDRFIDNTASQCSETTNNDGMTMTCTQDDFKIIINANIVEYSQPTVIAFGLNGKCTVTEPSKKNGYLYPVANSECDGMSKGDWIATFQNKKYKGIAKCSTTEGERFAQTEQSINDKTGQYCWCKTSNNWVYYDSAISGDGCEKICAHYCAFSIYGLTGQSNKFRKNLGFGE